MGKKIRQMMRLTVMLLLSGLGGGTALASDAAGRPKEDAPSLYSRDQIERGRYLVTITGCNDCHTPFKMGPGGAEPDMTRMLSGHPETLTMPPAPQLPEGPWVWTAAGTNTAFAGPWGISYATNLTPDENTGIGAWDEAIFMDTLRNGQHWGVGRTLLPPMPWQNYRHLTDDDLKAMFAYLRSLAPIVNRVPEAVVIEPPAQ